MKNQKVKEKEKKEDKGIKKSEGVDELKSRISKTREELFAIQLEQSQRKLKNTASLTLKRKEIARLLTTLRALELTQ